MTERSLLDTDDETEIEVSSPNVKETIGEIKRRRGRPPGSRNKPKDDGLATNLENAIRGLFGLLEIIAKWFGFEQTSELNDDEASQGARAFVPIAMKFPWLAIIATYVGAPVWLLRTVQKKFKRKVKNEMDSRSNRGAGLVPIGEPGETAANDSH